MGLSHQPLHSRRAFLRLGLGATCASLLSSKSRGASASSRPNILFIAVDDWNDWLGCLGHEQVKTPNADRLAARGLRFTNAHCSAPVCNPSRTAVFTGVRPSTSGIYNNNQPIHVNLPEAVTLPRYFRNQGYDVCGGGKILHESVGFAIPDDWDEYFLWHPGLRKLGWWGRYSWPPIPQPEPRPATKITRYTKRNFDWAALDAPDTEFPDYKVASWASDCLKRDQEKPFFLAVGIFRPHVPWFNNRKWFDQYDLEGIDLPPYKSDDTDDLPEIAVKWAKDRGSRHDRVQKFGLWEEAIRAYYASISFADAQLGRILDALNAGPHRDNTIVVFWSDHGYHLGEKDHWHKFTLWERSTRVPLIVAAPGMTSSGQACDRPVSLVDLYPTLVEMAGLPPRRENEGRSLLPLLKDPQADWPYSVVTTHGRNNHAIRSEHFRYIRYEDGSEELYDHRSDPNEWKNLADEPAYDEDKKRLAQWLPKTNAENGLDYKRGEVLFNPDTYDWKRREDTKPGDGYVNALSVQERPLE